MPVEIEVPRLWRHRGWRIKIRENERLEAPHVTILFKTWSWRVSLRTLELLDASPAAAELPSALVELLKAEIEQVRRAWDLKYPENPVFSLEVPDE